MRSRESPDDRRMHSERAFEGPFSLDRNYLQPHGSAEYFHGVPADTDIRNVLPFPRCPDKYFARATTLDALPNHHHLIIFCDAVLYHPTRGAASRRSRGRVFATVEEHSSSSFEPPFA